MAALEASYRYFENRACKYYPCHAGIEEMNCLFCYCPLYALENCPGTPRFIERDGRRIKDCTTCTFPHVPEHYEKVNAVLRERKARDGGNAS